MRFFKQPQYFDSEDDFRVIPKKIPHLPGRSDNEIYDNVGPLPFQHIRFVRRRLIPIQQDPVEEQFLNEAFKKSASSLTYKKTNQEFNNVRNLNMYMDIGSEVLLNLITEVCRYRNHVVNRSRKSTDYSPHRYYPNGHFNKYTWPYNGVHGAIWEVFIPNVINAHFGRNIFLPSPWWMDLAMGIDGFIDGTPIDITSARNGFLSKKIQRIQGKSMAILTANTFHEGCSATLLRELLLYSNRRENYKPDIEYGNAAFPAGYYEANEQSFGLCIQETAAATVDQILPNIMNEVTYDATTSMLTSLVGGDQLYNLKIQNTQNPYL